MREPEWRTRSHLMAMRVCTSEDCPCSSHNLRYLLYIGEFVLYTRDLVSGTEAEERGRKVEKVLSHGGIRLEPKVSAFERSNSVHTHCVNTFLRRCSNVLTPFSGGVQTLLLYCLNTCLRRCSNTYLMPELDPLTHLFTSVTHLFTQEVF